MSRVPPPAGAGGAASVPPAPVRMHPEATADPATVRWVIPGGGLSFSGQVGSAPGRFGQLLAAGELSAYAEPGVVLVTLAWPRNWRANGAAVRSGLTEALSEPDGWEPAPRPAEVTGEQLTLDAELRHLAEEAIAGAPGEYVRSHGGSVELVDVRAGRVVLRMSGSCRRCPASAVTLHRYFEQELRKQCPGIVEIVRAHV